MRFISALSLAAAHNARYPQAQPGQLESVSAAAKVAGSGKLDSVEAAAFKPFSSASDLVCVKAKSLFLVNLEHISPGDIVEVEENVARRLISSGQAEAPTDEEVAAAKKGKA